MAFEPGNQEWKKREVNKPYRDALRMEEALASQGQETPGLKGSLRWIARQQLIKAGGDTSAANHIADRFDGKPAQAIIGGEDDDPSIKIQAVARVIIEPGSRNSD